MPTTSDYLTQLQQDREDLVDNLEAKGITGLTGDETFTELVPEVLNIPSGGGDISEYLKTTINWNATLGGDLNCYRNQGILKLENIDIDSSVTSIIQMFYGLDQMTSFSFKKNVDNHNISDVIGLFESCRYLVTADLSGLTADIQKADRMFYGCRRLTFFDIRNFTFDNVTSANYMLENVPTNCEIIVKSQTEKDWFATNFSSYTNVKTVAEYEAE